MISYESFEVFVQNQARMAKRDIEIRDSYHIGVANGREDAVTELAKYLNVSEAEVKRLWNE